MKPFPRLWIKDPTVSSQAFTFQAKIELRAITTQYPSLLAIKGNRECQGRPV